MSSAEVSTTEMTEEILDAVIVGAGFGGVYQLKRLRDAGYNVKLFESGSDYGGVWYWNRYPGARVDSAIPHYEFSDPLLWRDWTWKERFPGSAELRAYFKYVAEKWALRKDTIFDCFVEKAVWREEEKRWSVTTKDGRKYKAKFFLLNTGFAAKRHIPDWNGVGDFKGTFLHPSYWPHEDPDVAGKRIAIIGTGATGVQLASELSKVASKLTVFQRTPNLALPMRQVQYDLPVQAIPRENYPDLYSNRKDSFTGLSFNFLPRTTFTDTPEQRRDVYESLWAEGDFHFWLGTYSDMLFDRAANEEAYVFWREKVRARVEDPKIADLLAPMQQPHAFGCKRISLETDYFEIFNQDNVTLVDTSDAGTPIQAITAEGIKTQGGQEHHFDVIISATGYDAVTGGLTNIDVQGRSGATLKQTWSAGVQTYLGMASHSFPNMFFTYGPQAPTAFCNGPTCAEYQGDWILQVMEHMRERGLEEVEVTEQSQKDWKIHVAELAGKTLLTEVDSWYMGANVPGKKREPLVYMGGVPAYYKTLADVKDKGFEGLGFA